LKGKHKIGTQIVINPDGNHEKVVAGNEMNVPGPGTYTASYRQQTTSLSTRFGQEKRSSMCVKGADKQPAPNAYDKDAASKKVMKSAPSFGFGSSKRPASHDTRLVPGPGAY
jgi:hypothetical protein